MASTFAAVVIHHRRFPEVLDTVRALIDAGVPAASVLVVDNSEDDDTARRLGEAAEGWLVHTMPNRGYGAAANAAVSHIPDADIVLIVTHEVRVNRTSVAALVHAVAEEPRVAAAGPALIMTDHERVWSRGGVLTRRLRLPRQVIEGVGDAPGIRDVDWLDGSCVAYRVDVLTENPFREDFFLYFEETELHTRLRARGWRVVTVGGSTAYQSSRGMPAFWGCRNVVLFQRSHGTRWSRRVAPLWFTARAMAIGLTAGDWREVRDAPRGLLAGCRSEGASPDG